MNYPVVKIKRTEDRSVPTVEIEDSRLVEVSNDVFRVEDQRKLSRGSDLASNAFFLPEEFDWILANDNRGQLCLVQLKKDAPTIPAPVAAASNNNPVSLFYDPRI